MTSTPTHNVWVQGTAHLLGVGNQGANWGSSGWAEDNSVRVGWRRSGLAAAALASAAMHIVVQEGLVHQ
jgi:hypothetical protein